MVRLRQFGLFRNMLIQVDKVPEGDRETGFLGFAEWVEAECAFQACHDDGERQRIEPGMQQLKVICEWRQAQILFLRDLFKLSSDLGAKVHRLVFYSPGQALTVQAIQLQLFKFFMGPGAAMRGR